MIRIVFEHCNGYSKIAGQHDIHLFKCILRQIAECTQNVSVD